MSPLRKLLGIRLPIIQGGMTWVSRSELVAAVANAGALGTLGAGGMGPEELRDEIRATRARTSERFAVNVPLLDFAPNATEDVVARRMEVVLEEGVPIVVTSGGSPRRFTEQLHEAGRVVVHVVPSVLLAQKSAAAGVDAIVAEGVDAGGHVRSGGLSTLALVPQVVDAVDVPVIAAGGISNGRGVLAMLALGAEAAQLGTRFVATLECNAHARFKESVVEAKSEDALLYSRAYHASRALATPIIERLVALELEGASVEELRELRGRERAYLGCIEGDLEQGILPAGTGVGGIDDVPSVAGLIAELERELQTAFKALPIRLARPSALPWRA